MTVYKNGSETRVNNILEALEVLGRTVSPRKKNGLAKHCGKLKWDVDGLEYQRKVRDEWN